MLASDEDSGTVEALSFSLASDIVELVVLTGDEPFLQTMRDAVGSARRLWHVPSGDKVSDLLVAGEVGIVVLDVHALIGPSNEFVAQIKRQFPDLVIVVAGNRDDETALAGLISAGVVYRFIHKPVSPARARLFAEAAVRKYGEHRRRAAQLPPRPQETSPRRAWMVGLAAGAMGVIAIGMWAWQHNAGGTLSPAPPIATARTFADATLLARAAAAMAANRLTEPSGDNALELYLQAQARYPADPQARAGLSEVHERLLARAENALLEERLDEAAQAIETARRAGVESGRIAFLSAQLAKSREQLKATQAQLRLKSEPKAPAIDRRDFPAAALIDAAADSATKENPATAQDSLASAGQEAASDARRQLLQKAEERLQQDRLIEPANDSATMTALQQRLETASAQQRFLANIIPSAQLTLLKTVQPTYPKKAAADKLQGWVELDFTVGENGEVKDIVVHAASVPGIFDDAAIKSVAQWRYQPVLQEGKPVPTRTRVRIRFTDP